MDLFTQIESNNTKQFVFNDVVSEEATNAINRCEIVDLFCGVGGLTHGFIKESFKVKAGIDNDKSCHYAYEANNRSTFIAKDINDVTSTEINNLYSENSIKILVGCAPCQPFSSYNFKNKEYEGAISLLYLKDYSFDNLSYLMNDDFFKSRRRNGNLINVSQKGVLIKNDGDFVDYSNIICNLNLKEKYICIN